VVNLLAQDFSMNSRLYHGIILAVCAVVITAAFLCDVDKLGIYLFGWKWPMKCFLHRFFDVDCALCGMSRSFVSLAKGNLADSFEYHLLGPFAFAFFAMQIPYRITAIIKCPAKTPAFTKIMTGAGVFLLAAVFFRWFYYLFERFLWKH
jgi:hypothetical protein